MAVPGSRDHGTGLRRSGCAPDGMTTVWSGAQKPHALQQGLAELLHVPQDRVRVIWVEDAGSYGRAGYEDVAADAVLLSQAVGKPVRVQWTRADMTQWGGKGPAGHCRSGGGSGCARGGDGAATDIARAFRDGDSAAAEQRGKYACRAVDRRREYDRRR